MFYEESKTCLDGRALACCGLIGFLFGPEKAACFLAKLCPEEGWYAECSR